MNAFMINTMMGNTLGYRAETEKMIRQSGLDYSIIRVDKVVFPNHNTTIHNSREYKAIEINRERERENEDIYIL